MISKASSFKLFCVDDKMYVVKEGKCGIICRKLENELSLFV